ncbi:MAG: hypothetical protein WCK86_10365 [Planctomycetia bacterium]
MARDLGNSFGGLPTVQGFPAYESRFSKTVSAAFPLPSIDRAIYTTASIVFRPLYRPSLGFRFRTTA